MGIIRSMDLPISLDTLDDWLAGMEPDEPCGIATSARQCPIAQCLASMAHGAQYNVSRYSFYKTADTADGLTDMNVYYMTPDLTRFVMTIDALPMYTGNTTITAQQARDVIKNIKEQAL